MFKKLFGSIKSLFSTLFGGNPSESKPDSRPEPAGPGPQDGSEINPDTIVVQVDEKDPVFIDPQTPDVEFEEDMFGEEEEEETPTPPPVTPAPEEEPSPPPISEEPSPADPAPQPSTPAHQARFLWLLDNGHGSLTAGKRSPVFDDGETQFLEYEFNRDIVRRIIEQLEAKGVRYVNVVPEVDVDNILQERVNRANAQQSDLPKIFVSVHANAAPARSMNHWGPDSVSGIETWFYHGSKRGQKVASIFQRHLVDKTGWVNRHIKSKPRGQFYVLRATKMTAVLTENGFYNNKKQALDLMREEVRQRIADAHVAAILEIEEKGI